jgi:hypothetical protein
VAKPIVNGIEKDLQGRATVVRLNLLTKLGREVARSHGVTAVPATMVFDGAGRVLYRHEGLPDRRRIMEVVNAMN